MISDFAFLQASKKWFRWSFDCNNLFLLPDQYFYEQVARHDKNQTCSLFYKICTIVTYDRNDSNLTTILANLALDWSVN